MPEVIYTVQLCDGEIKECYSPSSIVREYFTVGEKMSMTEFLKRSRHALNAASDRVFARFGFVCSAAAAQLTEIEYWASQRENDSAVQIISIS